MKSIQGSKTEKNLMAAFAGESQARNRYTFFASKAKEEGFFQVSLIFEETANQEKEHAKRFFKLLEGGEVTITGTFPAGVVGTTSENLQAAASGENHEWQQMYPDFAKTAREEGFEAVAMVFESITIAEKQHAHRYEALKKTIDTAASFRKDKPVIWRCLNCGFLFEGPEAPKACPACAHPQGYFEVLAENF